MDDEVKILVFFLPHRMRSMNPNPVDHVDIVESI
jgi:hypothetical protein